MPQYAALLRGIAPSGTNMSNDQLRGVFERLGFDRVASVLASGNIVFASDETDVSVLEDTIESALTSDLGLNSRTIVRSRAELAALLESDPFTGLIHGSGTYLTATFLKDATSGPVAFPTRPDPLTRIVGYDEPARAVLAVTDVFQAQQCFGRKPFRIELGGDAQHPDQSTEHIALIGSLAAVLLQPVLIGIDYRRS